MLRAIAIAVLLGCGSTTQAPAPKPAEKAEADLPALPRSSIAAVILHRDDLKLTDEQVKGLQEIDEDLAEREKAMTEKPSAGPRPDGGVAPGGGGMAGGRLHMTGSHGGGGHRPRPSGGNTPSASKGGRSVHERMDDADTRAYLRAEEQVLAPEQRDRARDIAEKYREDLYDRRARAGSEEEE